MPPQEQADLWMALRDRMKAPWTELTIQEKKAGMSATASYTMFDLHTPYRELQECAQYCSFRRAQLHAILQHISQIARKAILTLTTAYYIAFGPHGPRAEAPPGEGMQIFKYTMIGVVVSVGLFYLTRMFARGPPKTMSAEWQEASNAYMKVRFVPIFLLGSSCDIRMILTPHTEREHRTHHRCFLRRLQRPRYGPEQEDRPETRATRGGRRGRRVNTNMIHIMGIVSFVTSGSRKRFRMGEAMF
jgi:hypothetical protein